MTLIIKIEIDNDAFNDAGEIIAILRDIGSKAEDTEGACGPRKACDTNGNTVGTWEITP